MRDTSFVTWIQAVAEYTDALSAIAALLFLLTIITLVLRGRRISSVHLGALRINFEAATAEIASAARERDEQLPPRSELEALLRKIKAGPRILWVDDRHPHGNRHLRAALEAVGAFVTCGRSNAGAVEWFKAGNTAQVVISDIDRGEEGATAGLELPKKISACLSAEARVPAFIFFVSRADQTNTPDGHPVTNNSGDLLRLVASALSALT